MSLHPTSYSPAGVARPPCWLPFLPGSVVLLVEGGPEPVNLEAVAKTSEPSASVTKISSHPTGMLTTGFKSLRHSRGSGDGKLTAGSKSTTVRTSMAITSKMIFDRLKAEGVPMFANSAIGEHLSPDDIDTIEYELTQQFKLMLKTMLIEANTDHNTNGTAKRLAKMYLREVFAGRYEPMPRVTDFPNAKKLDELYSVGPVTVRSACSHHFCPIEGQLWCGVIPGERIIGLSKFTRLSRWVMARPQIQEEAIVQLADLLEELLKPRGLAVVMRARHTCMTWRGVMENSTSMTTSVCRGIMKNESISRAEFFSLVSSQEFACR
jgi:GTP cyclohydrolase IA